MTAATPPLLTLRKPDISLHPSYLMGLAELTTDSDRYSWMSYWQAEPGSNIPRFDHFVNELLARENNAPQEWVRETILWAVCEKEVVGVIALRCELNDLLSKYGGHIGYIVRPSWRGRGYGTEMLRQLLATEQTRSIGSVLLTCDDNNIVSERVIAKNGGVFESVIDGAPEGTRKKRYWIHLA